MTGLAGNGYLTDEVVRFLLIEHFKPHRYVLQKARQSHEKRGFKNSNIFLLLKSCYPINYRGPGWLSY